MNYAEPEIVKTYNLETAIQHSVNKGAPYLLEADPRLPPYSTLAAYEADE